MNRVSRRPCPTLLALTLCISAGLASCADEPSIDAAVDAEVDATPDAVPDICEPWPLRDFPSSVMAPGEDCAICHDRTRGPLGALTIAGTAFATLGVADGCKGREALEIVVVDAGGRELRFTSNLAGNFYTEEPDVVFPVQAGVIAGGVVRMMVAPVETGSCNSCHTAEGANGAPGRIVPPV